MLELEGLSLPIVCTIIVVTMASWFLCCWRKKQAVNVTDGKTTKAKQASINGSKKEKTETPCPPEEKSGNGAISQRPSPAPQPTADVGDFSVVQRETEILRSYRKPAPPKNRARQSRAPRAMNRSTENLDIFTELSEDELKSSDENEDNPNDHVTTADESTDHISDETDGVKFRTTTGYDSGKRETRSSMLADIEKTLAGLHSTEERSQVENTDKQDDLFQDKEAGRSSTLSTETHSAQSSPSSKPKAAPKVSPKPIPRKRNTGPKTPEKDSQIQDSEVLKESSDTKSDDISDQTASSQAVTTLAIQLDRSSAAIVDSQESTPTQETCTQINSTTINKQSDIGLSDTSKCAETSQEGTQESSQLNTESEASTAAKEGNVKTSISCEHVSTASSPSTSLQDTGQTEQEDVPTSTQTSDIKPEHTNESESNNTEPKADVANTQEIPQADQESTKQEVHKTEESVAAEDSSLSQQQSSQESKAESDQRDSNIEKTNESADDQSAKGKISKIPIRAGSKKESTPPLDKVPSTK